MPMKIIQKEKWEGWIKSKTNDKLQWIVDNIKWPKIWVMQEVSGKTKQKGGNVWRSFSN